MPASNYTIIVTLNGMAPNPMFVQPHDTVKWQDSYGEGTASITFTSDQDGPFTETKSGLDGTVTIKNGQYTSAYTISTTTKSGKYYYEVKVHPGAGTLTFTGSIAVGEGTVED